MTSLYRHDFFFFFFFFFLGGGGGGGWGGGAQEKGGYFNGLSNRIIRKKYLVTRDWSQSSICSMTVAFQYGAQRVKKGHFTTCE